jgi:tetratricopeptide (TPR) repeat protein
LTDDQIERYVQQGNDLSGNGPFEAHLAECEPCRSRVLNAERNRLGLRPGKRDAGPSSDCPPEDDLQAFAAGVGPSWILEHVAECDYCAPLLQEYLAAIQEDIEPDLEPDPEPGPSRPAVPEKSKAGGNSIPKKISSGIKKAGESFHLAPVFAKASLAGAAVMLACIPVVPSALNAYKLNKAEKAITAASQESPLKMRLSWGTHPQAPLLKDPTKPPSPADSPPLALAAKLASDHQNLTDLRWIRLRGRVKLILGEYDDSANLLALVTETGLNDPDTEIDLAVAGFQRDTQSAASGSSPGHSLSESLELLGKVLKNPTLTPKQRATATFDLAMVYQQMQLWDEAMLTWEKYLELDPAGAWHDDAQRSLEEAKKKIPPPKPQGYRSPDFFLQHFSDPTVLASLEEYVDIALREWLPEIDNKDGREASLAFGKLGQLMQGQHADPWVRDFLLARRAGDGPALIALGKAVRNNKIGWYGEARHQAQEAESLFAAVQHRPGQLRARFEAVYADQRLLQQKNCLKNAQALDESLLHTQYQWLRAQTAMELAACLNFANRTQDAQEQITKAQQIAIASNFPLLILRVQGWDAGINISDKGCESTVWNKTRVGLAQYWQGPSFPQRLYDFYSYLKLCAQKKNCGMRLSCSSGA